MCGYGRHLGNYQVEAEEEMRGRVDVRAARGQAESLALRDQLRAMEATVRHAAAEAAGHRQRWVAAGAAGERQR